MNRSLLATVLSASHDSFRAGDLEAVLLETRRFLCRFGAPSYPLPLPGGFSQVDQLLDAVGQELHEEFKSQPVSAQGGDWILATCVFEFGGHTPVMSDLAAALPAGLSGIILTLTGFETAKPTSGALARTGMPAESIHFADAPTMLETCRKVLRLFQGVIPRRLFLFHFPDDTAAIAAAAALNAAGTELWLVHHTDSYPAGGLFLPGVRILDLTPRACAFTRHVLGLRTTWLPLTCPDPGPPTQAFLRRGRLTTALSGGAYKTSQESLVSYSDVVASVLKATGGTHIHIGPLDARHRASILEAVAAAGLREEQFVHVPVAPTLVEVLRGEGVDLLLNTWPQGGARTAVEAMAAGVPMAWHEPYETTAQFRSQMAWPEAAVWHRVSDLVRLVGNADISWLSTQSRAARRQYEERHHPSRWRQFFSAPDSFPELPLPAGFDALRFLPALWDNLLHLSLDTYEARFADLRARLKRQHDKLRELSALKRRLRDVESELNELRFPWPVRLWRRWRRRGRSRKRVL